MATEVYELRINGTLNASYRQTVLHFQGVGVSSGDTLAAAESLVTGWDANIKTSFLATLPGVYSLFDLQARRATPKPSAVGYKSYGPFATPGTGATNSTAQQTCPSIFLVPSMGTKSGGKIFWPAIPAGSLIDSAYQAAWMTAVNTCLAAMLAGFTTAGITWTHCIFSRKLQTAATITGHNFSPVIGFQGRRRKPAGAVS